MPIRNRRQMKPLYLSLLLLSSLCARENPFFNASESATNSVTSNVPDKIPPLINESFVLPNEARVLKEVTFTIQNLDGSIETRKMEIDKSVDWHKSVVISQSQSLQTPAAPKAASADFGFIRFSSSGKKITIKTSDPVIRHFTLSDPDRIAIDFKHSASFVTVEKMLNAAPFKSVTLGNHGKFLRATITLDGRYSCSFAKNKDYITIVCK